MPQRPLAPAAGYVIRWRRPDGDGDKVADVLSVLTAADAASFTVCKASGEVVTIPRDSEAVSPGDV